MTPLALSVFAAISLPFAPPRSIQVTDNLKCDWGTVSALGIDGALVVETQSGPATFHPQARSPVLGVSGDAVETVDELTPGQAIRVYYTLAGESLDDGTFVREIDLQ